MASLVVRKVIDGGVLKLVRVGPKVISEGVLKLERVPGHLPCLRAAS